MKTRLYPNGFLNADDEFNSVQQSQCVNAENLRFASTDEGGLGRWELVKSNGSIFNAGLPAGTNTCLCALAEEEAGYLIFFIHNSNGDNAIFLYNFATSAFFKMLDDSDVTGGLNFSTDRLYPIQAQIVNHTLYWTDHQVDNIFSVNIMDAIASQGLTPPLSGRDYFNFPVDKSEVTLIKRPPVYPAYASKQIDATFPNQFIEQESFQFSYYYVYYNGEESVLAPYSFASLANEQDQDFNYLQVYVPFQEDIPDSVRMIRLVVRNQATNSYSVIKTWDKEIADEAAEISAHNALTTNLFFNYYNSITGEPVSKGKVSKNFDAVPNKARAIQAARNRIFLGNLTEGYATPESSSLTLVAGSSNTTISEVRTLISMRFAWTTTNGTVTTQHYYVCYYVQLTSVGTPGNYALTSTELYSTTGYQSLQPPYTYPTVPYSGLTYRGADDTAHKAAIVAANMPVGHTLNLSSLTSATSAASNITVTNLPIAGTGGYWQFKSKGIYQFGIVFYDFALRQCGVYSTDDQSVKIPARNYNTTNGVQEIDWTLSNTNALTEIPEWAYYYSIVRTLNLRTRYFVQGRTEVAKYATKDGNGDWVYTATTYTAGTTEGIALPLTSLIGVGLGYTFEEGSGDMCVLVTETSSTVHELRIIDQDGNYIIVAPVNVGNLSTEGLHFEFYKPYKASVEEPFYEVGNMYEVTNPATASRVYSAVSGKVRGDARVITRYSTIKCEAMNLNDQVYQRWDTDAGRLHLKTKEGEVTKKTAVCFSNTYVPGTRSNGLSTFDALDQEILPTQMGAIEVLMLTSKVQSEGTVMLTIGNNECVSLYLGEAQITDTTGSTVLFSKAVGVIGQVNVLKGSYGTHHPESVVLYKGNVYFFDQVSSTFVQYSANGLDDICKEDFKMGRVARKIALLGSGQKIYGGVDSFHRELYWTIPSIGGGTSPKGDLSDYTVTGYVERLDYPYDILDYRNKTLVFKPHQSKWMGAFQWTPERFTSLGNTVYMFKAGVMWTNAYSTTYNSFFGTQRKGRLMLVCNEGNVVKEFTDLQVEASEAPEWVHLRTERPYVQSSDLVAADFAEKEGIFSASLYRDRLSPNVSGSAEQKMTTGDPMRGQYLLIQIQITDTALAWIRLCDVGFQPSSGH